MRRQLKINQTASQNVMINPQGDQEYSVVKVLNLYLVTVIVIVQNLFEF